jgi:glycosyltransferase involved in cell wall biosynthesis
VIEVVSAYIYTYNNYKKFVRAFETVIKKDYDEIVVVNDASTIDTDKYEEYFNTVLLKTIKVFNNKTHEGFPSRLDYLKDYEIIVMYRCTE